MFGQTVWLFMQFDSMCNRITGAIIRTCYLTCRRTLQSYARSDRLLSFSVGSKLIRHSHLQATLLLCFLVLYVPGYGLHALVGIGHDAQPNVNCECCAFGDAEQRGNSDGEDSDELPSSDRSECCVCKLLATPATFKISASIEANVLVSSKGKVYRDTLSSVSQTSRHARGPPTS